MQALSKFRLREQKEAIAHRYKDTNAVREAGRM
jgi:hypothetical protein